jgi:hypothetical protein
LRALEDDLLELLASLVAQYEPTRFSDGSQTLDATSRAQLAKFFNVSEDVFLTNESRCGTL